MSSATRHTLEIPCHVANPVMYLACCGLLDLLARLDPDARGSWHAAAPTAFRLDSALKESAFLAVLLDTLCDPDRWKFLPEGTDHPTVVNVQFKPKDGDAGFTTRLDWWYETVKPVQTGEGEIAWKIEDNSAWKMYAGNMSVKQVTTNMLGATADVRRVKKMPNSLAELLDCEAKMTGRFGFDPRSSRGPLDVGFSFNNLRAGEKAVDTAIFAELLALFGIASFFPARVGRPGWLDSTRGWLERQKAVGRDPGREPGFRYRLWSRPLTVALARHAALAPNAEGPMLFSPRAARGKLYNLTFSQSIQPHTTNS